MNLYYNSFKVKMFRRKWQDMFLVCKDIYFSKEKYVTFSY